MPSSILRTENKCKVSISFTIILSKTSQSFVFQGDKEVGRKCFCIFLYFLAERTNYILYYPYWTLIALDFVLFLSSHSLFLSLHCFSYDHTLVNPIFRRWEVWWIEFSLTSFPIPVHLYLKPATSPRLSPLRLMSYQCTVIFYCSTLTSRWFSDDVESGMYGNAAVHVFQLRPVLCTVYILLILCSVWKLDKI